MKILILGFLAFFGWSALSTHIWVCNVKGLCRSTTMNKLEGLGVAGSFNADTVKLSAAPLKTMTPGDMTVYYEFDRSDFTKDSLTERYFAEAKAFLDKNSGAYLTITGYTDFIGTDDYNKSLGLKRAASLQNYFDGNGIRKDKIMMSSKGEKDPAGDNITAKGRADNRRTVITIIN